MQTGKKYLVTWDFAKRPGGTFYRVLTDEFGHSHAGGAVELIQRSVAICRDDFVASRLAALAKYYGAKVDCFQIERAHLADEAHAEAHAFVVRVLHRRLHQRGRRPTRLRRR